MAALIALGCLEALAEYVMKAAFQFEVPTLARIYYEVVSCTYLGMCYWQMWKLQRTAQKFPTK